MLIDLLPVDNYEDKMNAKIKMGVLLPPDLRHRLREELRFENRFHKVDKGIYDSHITPDDIRESTGLRGDFTYEHGYYGVCKNLDSLKDYYNKYISRGRDGGDHIIQVEYINTYNPNSRLIVKPIIDKEDFISLPDEHKECYQYVFSIFTIYINASAHEILENLSKRHEMIRRKRESEFLNTDM